MEEEGGRETMNQSASHAKVPALSVALVARRGQWHARRSEEDQIGGGSDRRRGAKGIKDMPTENKRSVIFFTNKNAHFVSAVPKGVLQKNQK